MYTNLKTVLSQKGITVKQYAQSLGISEQAARRRLQGKTDFTYLDFEITCEVLFPEYHADYLFMQSEPEDTERENHVYMR